MLIWELEYLIFPSMLLLCCYFLTTVATCLLSLLLFFLFSTVNYSMVDSLPNSYVLTIAH